MKRILSLVLLVAFGMVIVGCQAEGKVTDNDSHPDGVKAKVDVDTK